MSTKLEQLKAAERRAEFDFLEATRFLDEAVQEHRDAAQHYEACRMVWRDARIAWLNEAVRLSPPGEDAKQ